MRFFTDEAIVSVWNPLLRGENWVERRIGQLPKVDGWGIEGVIDFASRDEQGLHILDWKLGADQIADRIVSRTENGAIICLHDGRGVRANPDIAPTLAAVERIIPVLQSRGFIFETVSQILCPNN